MTKEITKEEQITWDRLQYGVPPNTLDRSAWTYATVKPVHALTGSIYFDEDKTCMMVYDGKSWRTVQ